jgi:hypothetical protein
LEAQCETVAMFLNGGNWQLIKEFVEVETGTRRRSPAALPRIHVCLSIAWTQGGVLPWGPAISSLAALANL